MADPALARADGATLQLLSELSHCLQRVAVISGRDAGWLAERLPIASLTLVGNHGLEEWEAGRSRAVPEARPFLAAIARAGDAVAHLEEVHRPGVAVERKLATLAVHFRNAPDPPAAQVTLEEPLQRIADREHLQLYPGRMVWELRPPLDISKGTAVRRLARFFKPEAVVYVGDDVTDADAFGALRAMTGIKTLAIGVRSAEAPNGIFDDCDLVLEDRSRMRELLDALRARCPRPDGGGAD